MPTQKGRYDPTQDYAYDPADMNTKIGEDLGRFTDPVEQARAHIRANEDAVRSRQETALTRRQTRRAQGPQRDAPQSGGAKAAEHLKTLDDLLKQQ